MRTKNIAGIGWFVAIMGMALAGTLPAGAALKTWTGTGTNDWWTGANWNESTVPQAGDDVLITNKNVGVLLTNATPWLSSLVISNASGGVVSLIFSNWNTTLSATNVMIGPNGTLTHPPQSATATNGAGQWVPDNRVWIVCTNLTVATNGSINVDTKGWIGAPMTGSGRGPGGGAGSAGGGGGGGYGGAGGSPGGGATNGTPDTADAPGSGGGWASNWGSAPGGAGGGVIRIEAAGMVTVNGTLTANGGSVTDAGGGAGGGIYIACDVFAGTGGVVRANGGASGSTHGGGGGGGRIAVLCSANQATQPKPRVTLSALRGTGGVSNGGIGSLRLADTSILDPTWIPHNGNVYIPNWTAWNMDTLLVTNGWFSIPGATNLQISVTNDVAVWGSGGILEFEGARLDCGGNLLLQSNAALIVRSANTNGVSPDYGALVSVTGNISVATGTWIYAHSATNGGAPLFRAGSLTVAAGGNFTADGRGYAGGTPSGNGQGGAGGGKYNAGGSGGGGHGGAGGNGAGPGAGGSSYGSSNAPVEPGGGGAGDSNWGQSPGGAGGGVIRIEAGSSVLVNGILSANGNGGGGQGAGAGAGGSIQVRCNTFGGSNGTVRANGGTGSSYGGGGGGGRIAILRMVDAWTGTPIAPSNCTASGAGGTSAQPGGTGTVYIALDPNRPLIEDLPAVNILAVSADLVGTLLATGNAPTEVYCFWGTNDGANVMGAWGNTNYLGTNAVNVLTNHVSSLAASTIYYYRFYAVNASGYNWASASATFSTMGSTLLNNAGGASGITLTTAILNGQLTAANPNPDTIIYWGPTDGVTNKTAWSNWIDLGVLTNWSFSAPVSGLLANGTYYYRCYATNVNGDAWAPSTTNFTTLLPALTIGGAQVTKGISSTFTNAVFPVTLSAPCAAPVTVNFGEAGGTAVAGVDYYATNGTLAIPAGSSNGTITVVVIGGNVDQWPSVDFYVNLSNIVDATFANSQAHGVIIVTNDTPETKIWTGTGDWFTLTNWSPSTSCPSPSDTVIIQSGTDTCSSALTIGALTVNAGASLVMTNWSTKLTVGGDVTINGTITHLPQSATTTNAFGQWAPDSRVWIVCTNLTVAAGGSINVDSNGWTGAPMTGSGRGPGGGAGAGDKGGGGGYGGAGGSPWGGATNGTPDTADAPGSGGGWTSFWGASPGGAGGGVIRIEASGRVTVNGTMTANGGSANEAGGGAGGGIYIACDVFAGTGGVVRANGGNCANGASRDHGGGGGGGRIAVLCSANQATQPKPRVMLSALRGTGGVSNGGIGSLRLADASVLDPTWIPHNGNVYIPNWTAWNMDYLLVTNGCFSIPAATNLQISVTNDVTVWGSGGILEFEGARLDCGGNLLLQSNAALIVRSANTNGVSPDYGALVNVAGNISVATGTWIYAYSATNGGAPLFRAGSLTVASGGGFNADGRGYAGGTPSGNGQGGSGGGKYNAGGSGGGGHGGPGGNGSGGLGGGTYGSSNAPVTPGSGGAGCGNWGQAPGGPGGGVIRIEAGSSVLVNGMLSANGSGGGGQGAGGGAGGSIQVRCRTFAGSNGTLRANGGAAGSVDSGNGGGGRIAVWVGVTPTTVIPPSSPSYVPSLPKFTGSITATNGTGGAAAGSPGTVVLGDVTPAGTVFFIR